MIWVGIALVCIVLTGLAIHEFAPSNRVARLVNGVLSLLGGANLAGYNKFTELNANDVALIEKKLANLRSVVVLCSRVDEPTQAFKKAVLDNFAEGVTYSFFVSKQNDDRVRLKRYRDIFLHLYAAACTAAERDEVEASGGACLTFDEAFSIRVLPLEWSNVPYLFYTFSDGDGSSYLIAYKGTDAGVGIARSYLRVDETEARAILELCAAASVDLEQAFATESYEIVEQLPSKDGAKIIKFAKTGMN